MGRGDPDTDARDEILESVLACSITDSRFTNLEAIFAQWNRVGYDLEAELEREALEHYEPRYLLLFSHCPDDELGKDEKTGPPQPGQKGIGYALYEFSTNLQELYDSMLNNCLLWQGAVLGLYDLDAPQPPGVECAELKANVRLKMKSLTQSVDYFLLEMHQPLVSDSLAPVDGQGLAALEALLLENFYEHTEVQRVRLGSSTVPETAEYVQDVYIALEAGEGLSTGESSETGVSSEWLRLV